MNTYHFSDIASANEFWGWPAPEHPLLSVVSVEPNEHRIIAHDDTPITISDDFYSISLKTISSGEILYGRTKYDFKKGTMLFKGPRQKLVLKGISISSRSRSIAFHEDFIKGYDIRHRIKKYGFFSYSTNEALHLSPKEERLVESIMDNIETEYHNNQDEFSKEIILSQIDTLLKYANRFYKRQFLHRQEMAGQIVPQFERIISEYFESGRFEQHGTPRVGQIAKELDMSSRYLSDCLKAETGKTAIEHIHLYLINEAKNLLLEPRITVSETAYKLGFENPQYFSRFFKKKVGIPPSKYREQQIFSLN